MILLVLNYIQRLQLAMGRQEDLAPTKWGLYMVMLGKGWGNGICLPWKPWPPVPVPTIPVVASKLVDAPVTHRLPINSELDAASKGDPSLWMLL